MALPLPLRSMTSDCCPLLRAPLDFHARTEPTLFVELLVACAYSILHVRFHEQRSPSLIILVLNDGDNTKRKLLDDEYLVVEND
jgi:hypothetical protein